MVNLPAEVFNIVFLQLFQRDQLECMTVCRQWHDIISQNSIFRVIYIHSQQKLNKLIERVKREPTFGAKIEQLKLSLNVDNSFNDMIFFEYFPNLVEFNLIKYGQSDYDNSSLIQLQHHPWCETIQKMVESRSNPNTMAVLNSGLCRRLSHITVSGTHCEPIHNLVRGLANAPALKSLHLTCYLVSFPDLELLHSTLSSLNTLSFQCIKFDCTSFPLTIDPATSVKSFKSLFVSVGHIRAYRTYYHYISKKYTHLKELGLDMRSFSPYDLESIQVFVEYKATIKSHLKTLGNRLEKLSIHNNSLTNDASRVFDFNLLDECNCQIKQLKLDFEINYLILERIANTTQVYYLQSLEIKIKRLGWDEKGDVSLEWLGQFTMLKHLNITFSSYVKPHELYTLKLSPFLELLSRTKVEALTLNYLELNNDSSSTVQVYTPLKKLSLCSVTFKENIDVALSQVFPNLRRLKLNYCSLPGNALLLPDSYLSYLEIVGPYQKIDALALVNTLNNDQQRLYTASGQKYRFNQLDLPGNEEKVSNFISNLSKPYDKETDNPMLTITCKALWSFVMENHSY